VLISKVFWWDLMKRLDEFPLDQGCRVGQVGVVLACARWPLFGLAAETRISDAGRQGPGANRPLVRRPSHGGGDHDGIHR
jgi:hypothetical protein